MTPLLSGPRLKANNESRYDLPSKANYPFDVKSSPKFVMAYAVQLFGGFFGCTSVTFINCFLPMILFSLCGIFDTITQNIKNFPRTNNNPNSPSKNNQHTSIKCIVERHLECLRYELKQKEIFTILFYFTLLFFP